MHNYAYVLLGQGGKSVQFLQTAFLHLDITTKPFNHTSGDVTSNIKYLYK